MSAFDSVTMMYTLKDSRFANSVYNRSFTDRYVSKPSEEVPFINYDMLIPAKLFKITAPKFRS